MSPTEIDGCYRLTDRREEDGVMVETFTAGPHTASAWNPRDQHGGPVSGLLARALEHCDDRPGTRLSRVGVEILGPVPVGEVEVRSGVERPGRRIALASATMSARGPDGQLRPVASARGWRLATSDTASVATRAEPPLPPAPAPDAEGLGAQVLPRAWQVGFVNALDWHPVELPDEHGGPTSGWFRMRHPLVEGEEATPLQRTMSIVDVANGIGARIDPRHHTFLNTDVTVHLHDAPRGVWVGLRAETSVGADGVGTSAGTVHAPADDGIGVAVGRVAQNLLVERRPQPPA